jgi:hypothetical protein
LVSEDERKRSAASDAVGKAAVCVDGDDEVELAEKKAAASKAVREAVDDAQPGKPNKNT